MEDIRKAVLNMCKTNLVIKPNKKVLVLTDYIKNKKEFKKQFNATDKDVNGIIKSFKLAGEVYRIIKLKYPKTDFLDYPATGSHGREPGKKIALKMKEYNVIIILNYYSLTHTDAREQATKNGARVASMPRFERKMFFKNGPMLQNYKAIDLFSKKIASKITKTHEAVITAENGTEVYLKLGNRALADLGVIKKGRFSNLPAGEAYVVPKTGRGKLVINKGWFEGINENLILKFEEGILISIEGGGNIGNKLREKLFKKKHRRILAEFGIGTNPGAFNPTNVLESEKIKGSIHIAFGNSIHMPGGFNNSDSHIDFILNKPTVRLDGKLFIDKGKFVR